jgi:hypothetical protein
VARLLKILALALLLIAVGVYNLPDTLNGKGGISTSLKQSTELGVLLAVKTPSKRLFHVDGATSFFIQEVFYERNWRCGPGCETALEISADLTHQQVVVKCSEQSNFDELNGSWSLREAKTGEIMTSSGGNGLVFQHYTREPQAPLTFLLFKHTTLVDSLVLR